jgi:hypothetical protein
MRRQEKTPEGWENTVLALKDHPEVDNPWALANWMRDQGYSPQKEAGPLVKRAFFEGCELLMKPNRPTTEANAASALGALTRKGLNEHRPGGHDQARHGSRSGGSGRSQAVAADLVSHIVKRKLRKVGPATQAKISREVLAAVKKRGGRSQAGQGAAKALAAGLKSLPYDSPAFNELIKDAHKIVRGAGMRESARVIKEVASRPLCQFIPLREGDGGLGEHTAEVVLITEGAGNKVDRNFYPGEVIRDAAPVFEGSKCFLDHPTRSEEHERPERSVREQCGWFSNVRPGQIDGRTALFGTLNFMSTPAGKEARGLVESAIRYQKQFPGSDKVLAGLSINGEGPSHEEIREDGELWNCVDGIQKAISADLVTFPARGGKVLGFREAERSASWRARMEVALRRLERTAR